MSDITIKNTGPISEVQFQLNKINVFMGPQSSGKSTIAKICSQCIWCEKNYLLTGDEYDLYRGLLDFHRLEEGYFSDNSEIVYESQWVTIKFTGKNKKTLFTRKKKNTELYQNSKIEYIPAERNFVAALPNLEKYSDASYDNIINFLKDWLSFKETITNKGKYSSPLNSIDLNYKYDTKTKKDVLIFADDKKILLQRSSSGQQSIIPLLIVCEFMFTTLYTQKRISSSAEQNYIKRKLPESMRADYEWVIKKESFPHKSNYTQNIGLLEETKKKNMGRNRIFH